MAKTISCVLFVILRLSCLAAGGLEKEEDTLRQPVYANSAGHRPRYYVIRPSNNLPSDDQRVTNERGSVANAQKVGSDLDRVQLIPAGRLRDRHSLKLAVASTVEAPLAKKFNGKPEVLVQEDDAARAATSSSRSRTVLPSTPEPPKARHAGKYPVPSRASIKIMIATSAMVVAVAIVAHAAYLLIKRWKLDVPKDERVAPATEQPVVVYQYQ